MERRRGAPFVVKVLDFGIAKVLAEAKTAATAPLGTPLWMAPEQTQAGASIGAPTDVWALGLVAFRLLSGRIYWSSSYLDGASTFMLMREILFEPLGVASDRSAQLGGAELPPGFDGWFARCVVREVPQRFPDAATNAHRPWSRVHTVRRTAAGICRERVALGRSCAEAAFTAAHFLRISSSISAVSARSTISAGSPLGTA